MYTSRISLYDEKEHISSLLNFAIHTCAQGSEGSFNLTPFSFSLCQPISLQFFGCLLSKGGVASGGAHQKDQAAKPCKS